MQALMMLRLAPVSHGNFFPQNAPDLAVYLGEIRDGNSEICAFHLVKKQCEN